jgi:hypothetical protein
MSEQPEREVDHDQPEPVREAYTPPRLARHGTIEDLTHGAQGPIQGDQASGLQ